MTEDLVTMNYNRANDKTWMVNIDGKYSDVIREYLINDGIPEDGVDQILQNAAKHWDIVQIQKKMTYANVQELLLVKCKAAKLQISSR